MAKQTYVFLKDIAPEPLDYGANQVDQAYTDMWDKTTTNNKLLQIYVIANVFSHNIDRIQEFVSGIDESYVLLDAWEQVAAACREVILKRMKDSRSK